MGSVLGTTGGMLLDKNLWQGIKPSMSEKRCLVDKVRTDFCFRYETLLLKTRKKVRKKCKKNQSTFQYAVIDFKTIKM